MIGPLSWLIFCLILFPVPLWAAPLSARLQSVLTTAVEPVPVIVRLKSMDARARVQGLSHKTARRTLITDLKQQARQSQGPLVDFLRQQGVPNPKSLWLINGLAFSASPQLIAQLQNWPEVELISVNQIVPRPIVTPAATAGVEWNIDMIGAPQLWEQGIDGTGVVVASLDTGVDLNHPDLSASWRGGPNSWFDPYNDPPRLLPYDTGDGHGTAVMGVMVGGDSGGSAIGVAPGVQWIAAKIFPDTGPASNAKIIEAFGWTLDPDKNPLTDDGADIINNSWGFDNLENQCLTGADLTDYQVALTNLRTAGAAVVFSAGNTGPFSGSSIPPGNMSGVLAVGAVDSSSVVALFSARGPSSCDAPGEVFPSLVAPGVAVRSAGLASSFVNVSGTSFSAPHVAGALALLRQAFPMKSMPELEAAVQQMSVDLGGQGDDDDYGSGLLDVSAAYNQLLDIGPVLEISDPTAPANDMNVDFGSVAPFSSRLLSLQLKNGGGGSLAISSVVVDPLVPEFRVVSDPCSGLALAGGEICTVGLVFEPPAYGSYSSILRVTSSDSAVPSALTLVGLGNNAPPTPILQLPANGATGVARSVAFGWHRDADLDGDVVNDFLLISVHGDFSDSSPITTALPQAVMLVAGVGFLLGLRQRKGARSWIFALVLILSLLQVSCGGGGSASTASVPLTTTGEFQSDILDSNTTYYWKIRSVDKRGGVVESAVWSFTTL